MKNMPYNVMRHRDWDKAPRDPVTIGTAIITGLGGSAALAATTVAFGITVAGIVGYVATSLVTSWALSALAPKPQMGGDTTSRGLLVNQKDPISAHDFIYGQVRKGGVITYIETTGTENRYLHQVISLAGHEVEEIGDIYINDDDVTLDGSGFVTSDGWSSKIRVRKKLGTANQTADSGLNNASTKIDGDFRGRGIAYIYVRYDYDQDVFANGLPLVTAVIKGKKVFDPRTSTTAWSANAALCIRDYLTSEYGLSDDQIDDTAFSAAANICDENVSLSGGGTEKKYTINGVVRADRSHGDVLQDMLTACAGSLFWGGGKWKLVVGDYVAPTKVLTLDDLRGPISLSTRINVRDQFNGVQGIFNSASDRWMTMDYPSISSSTFVAQDGGEQKFLDLALPFTTSKATAQRLAKLTLYRAREQMTFAADFGLNAFDVEVGEIIALTNERYGWDEKEFECVGWAFGASDGGDLRVTLTLRETSEAAFDWNAEEQDIIANDSDLPDPMEKPTVGLTISAELRVQNEQVTGALLIDVSSNNAFADYFEVQFKPSASSKWVRLTQAQAVGDEATRFEALGITDGNYDVRARAVSVLGVRGPFTTITNWYATLFAPAPQTVSNFSGNVVGNTLHLSWTPVTDLDLSHYKIRYSSLTFGASYQNAVDLVRKIPRPGNTATVPSRTGTYFIKAIDKLGNLSEAAASIVIDTNVANIDNLNVVETLDQHPSFTGATSNVVAVPDDAGNNYLTLDTVELFDSLTGDFDDVSGLFDGGGPAGGVYTTGTYDFANYVDLGEKYVSRVIADLKIDFLDYIDTFDSASGFFDAREGDFDGDPSQFDTVSARTQISYTDDDPAGTPTWTAYKDFTVGDVSARAIRFRAILESGAANNAPKISELTATIDMPDRVEADDDITYTGSQVVTFPVAFKATPAIGIAATLADGDRYVISSKSRTGFTITTLTGGSVSTNATTIDYVAKGYGRELA
jgi:hypothetical protein